MMEIILGPANLLPTKMSVCGTATPVMPRMIIYNVSCRLILESDPSYDDNVWTMDIGGLATND